MPQKAALTTGVADRSESNKTLAKIMTTDECRVPISSTEVRKNNYNSITTMPAPANSQTQRTEVIDESQPPAQETPETSGGGTLAAGAANDISHFSTARVQSLT